MIAWALGYLSPRGDGKNNMLKLGGLSATEYIIATLYRTKADFLSNVAKLGEEHDGARFEGYTNENMWPPMQYELTRVS